MLGFDRFRVAHTHYTTSMRRCATFTAGRPNGARHFYYCGAYVVSRSDIRSRMFLLLTWFRCHDAVEKMRLVTAMAKRMRFLWIGAYKRRWSRMRLRFCTQRAQQCRCGVALVIRQTHDGVLFFACVFDFIDCRFRRVVPPLPVWVLPRRTILCKGVSKRSVSRVTKSPFCFCSVETNQKEKRDKGCYDKLTHGFRLDRFCRFEKISNLEMLDSHETLPSTSTR